jgi:hypothetical protein
MSKRTRRVTLRTPRDPAPNSDPDPDPAPIEYPAVAYAADAAIDLADAAVDEGWTIHPNLNRASGPPRTRFPPRGRLREVFARLNPNRASFETLDGMAWLLHRPAAADEGRWRLSAALMVAGIGWVARLWAAEGLCVGEQQVFSDYGDVPIPLGLLQAVAEGAAGVKAQEWPAPVKRLPAWCTRPGPLPLARVTPHVQGAVRAAAAVVENINGVPASEHGNVGADRELFRHLDRLDWHSCHVPQRWQWSEGQTWDDPWAGEVEWAAEGWDSSTSAHAGVDLLGSRLRLLPGDLGRLHRFRQSPPGPRPSYAPEWIGSPCHWLFWHPAARRTAQGRLPQLDAQRWSARLAIEAKRLPPPSPFRCDRSDHSLWFNDRRLVRELAEDVYVYLGLLSTVYPQRVTWAQIKTQLPTLTENQTRFNNRVDNALARFPRLIDRAPGRGHVLREPASG